MYEEEHNEDLDDDDFVYREEEEVLNRPSPSKIKRDKRQNSQF